MTHFDPDTYDTSRIVYLNPSPNRRIAVIMEEHLNTSSRGKTGISVIRYRTDDICCVIDSLSARAGKSLNDCLGIDAPIPIVTDMAAAMAYSPTEALIGVAPPGGRLPESYRKIVIDALARGVTVVSGLHQFLNEDTELKAIADDHSATIVDLRAVPLDLDCAKNVAHVLPNRRVLTVGSDCALGKMTVSIELDNAMRSRGLNSVFIPTGQTGIVIAGWGFAVDRVIADFCSGAVEMMIMEKRTADWQHIEGQGSLDHAAYGPVSLALIQGAQPTDMILVHHLCRTEHFGGMQVKQPINPLETVIRLHNDIARLYVPSSGVRAVAVNGAGLPPETVDKACRELEARTGLPCADVFLHGADKLAGALLAHDPH